MSKAKSEREREWLNRKQEQKPHGKVESLKELHEKHNKG
ncbi:MAG: hypothetical protein K0R71_2103 [Bacillales bacterium]|nr:hypothetical protein [Bacillales bacterium]